MSAPGFWMNETSGVLHDAVEAYLFNAVLTEAQITALCDYLRQWVNADGFQGPGIDELRQAVDGLTTRAALDRWIMRAVDEGIDPL
jgi:hypothetical protein